MTGIVRRKIKKGGGDLSLIPIMSLFLMLVPMLLLTAEFERAAVLDLFLPSSDIKAVKRENRGPLLTLTISVTPAKLQIVANKEKISIPSKLASKQRSFDLNNLRRELYKLKRKFPSSEEVVLLVGGDILYETIIDIMDACREISLPGGRVVSLFPNVALADRTGFVRERKDGKENTK